MATLYFSEHAATSSKPKKDDSSGGDVQPEQDSTKHRSFPKKPRDGQKLKLEAKFDLGQEKLSLPEEVVKKYKYGQDMKLKGVKTKYHKSKFEMKQAKHEQSAKHAARAEILLHEDQGFLEADEGEETWEASQQEISRNVDITSATKQFNLSLPKFGPYHIRYSLNGRHLLLGGRMGHVAALDWQTKKLHCETNVAETVRDVQWLHIETMFAVAQKRWTCIYDNQGVELHCLKKLHDIRKLQFLPYHFLLAAASSSSFLHWLDVSIGKMIASFPTKEGRLDIMQQNPANGVLHCAHPKGTVTLWSPNVKESLVKMLCHPCAVKGLAIDQTGTYMATSGLDRRCRIWDLRQYKQVHSMTLPLGLAHLAFSQKQLLAAAIGTQVQIFRDVCKSGPVAPYLIHDCRQTVADIQFCQFEDVLGIGHSAGFDSILVPGSGEANFDAMELNPYQTKSQRREYEVKALLDKIQPEMITLDNTEIMQVDTETLEETLEQRAKILYLKPEKIEFTPRHKMKGRSKDSKKEQIKQNVLDERKRAKIKVMKEARVKLLKEGGKDKEESGDKKDTSVLDRFKSKQK